MHVHVYDFSVLYLDFKAMLFWQGIPKCSKHCVMGHCRDEAPMISHPTILAFSHALTASNATECLCKCAD